MAFAVHESFCIFQGDEYMGIAELVVIAVGLSMDAFAVAVCKGLNMRKIDYVKPH